MTFQPLLARAAGEAPDPLYPLPGQYANSFVSEAGDGRPRFWEAEALTAKVGDETVGHAANVKAVLALTDSRVVVACTQFRTGGGWRGWGVGGAAVAIAANAVSKAAGARETRGYSLVGHVRHEWLRAVNATKSSWGTSTANAISLLYVDPVGGRAICRVNVHLPKRTVTAEVAREILRSALRDKMRAADENRHGELQRFLARLPSKPTANGRGESWVIP